MLRHRLLSFSWVGRDYYDKCKVPMQCQLPVQCQMTSDECQMLFSLPKYLKDMVVPALILFGLIKLTSGSTALVPGWRSPVSLPGS